MPIFGGPAGSNGLGFNIVAEAASTGSIGATVILDAALNAVLDETVKIADVLGAGGAAGDIAIYAKGSAEQSIGGAIPGMTGGGYEKRIYKR